MPDLSNSGRFFVKTVQDSAERIAKTLSDMRWTMVSAESDTFVTSDRPMTFLHATLKPGPGRPGSVVLFPLSPRRLLAMDDRHDQPSNTHVQLDHDARKSAFNGALLERSVRFMITGRPLSEVMAEIEARRKKSVE
jgi:hypothetical protein